MSAYDCHYHYGRAHHSILSPALHHRFPPTSQMAGIVFVFLAAGFLTRRFTFKSRWAFLLFHVVVRLGAQGVGIGLDQHGVISSTGLALLKAFITLSAEVRHARQGLLVAVSYPLSRLHAFFCCAAGLPHTGPLYTKTIDILAETSFRSLLGAREVGQELPKAHLQGSVPVA
jgi:hypothetical protein